MSLDAQDDEQVVEVLDFAGVMFRAVAGRHGPHVTPLAFNRRGDELGALSPRNSARARAVRRDPRVGVLVSHRGRTVIAGGRAPLVDPLTGRGLGATGPHPRTLLPGNLASVAPDLTGHRPLCTHS